MPLVQDKWTRCLLLRADLQELEDSSCGDDLGHESRIPDR